MNGGFVVLRGEDYMTSYPIFSHPYPIRSYDTMNRNFVIPFRNSVCEIIIALV